MIDQSEIIETARCRIGKATFKKNGCTLYFPKDPREARHDWVIDGLYESVDAFDRDEKLKGKLCGAVLVVWSGWPGKMRRRARIILSNDNPLWRTDIPDFVRNLLAVSIDDSDTVQNEDEDA